MTRSTDFIVKPFSYYSGPPIRTTWQVNFANITSGYILVSHRSICPHKKIKIEIPIKKMERVFSFLYTNPHPS
jgi:hypothetical protein